jgi:hypothetical protein
MHAVRQSMWVPAGDVTLEADIVVAEPALGVVLFAHGSGSGRHSPRNRQVAGELLRRDLFVDLLPTCATAA